MADVTEVPAYPYKGIALMPGIVSELTLELLPGQIIKRGDLAVVIEDEHVRRGGLPCARDLGLVAKKALRDLEARGSAEKTGAYGLWRIAGEPQVTHEVATPALDESEPLRRGVYAYTFPAYRTLAEQAGSAHFPMKVGMSDVDMEGRIRGQAGTSLPEQPEILKFFDAESPRLLEKALHAVLTLRGQYMDDAPGAEWYMTSPADLESIVDWIESGVQDEGAHDSDS